MSSYVLGPRVAAKMLGWLLKKVEPVAKGSEPRVAAKTSGRLLEKVEPRPPKNPKKGA
jgi:hypothetical protein